MIFSDIALARPLLFLFACSLWACNSTEDGLPSYAINARLKQTVMYNIDGDSKPIGITAQYEYDPQARISKVSSPLYNEGKITGVGSYDLYEYDAKGQLEKIVHFAANLHSGFINLQTKTYTYSSEGLKTMERVHYPQIGSKEYTQFTYTGQKLAKAEKFNNRDQLETYTEYTYQGDLLETEELYRADGSLLRITRFAYERGLNTKEEIFLGSTNERFREINRAYDSNRNLVQMTSRELSPVSSAMSFRLHFEYFR
ncbi:hypothetical protein ADIS_2290 [Lunatimonas lonarensis]|uniref:YD repeat-containing protein n=1 Tax=Lunatimonas lonarensis TaxID=1232681 RepID=R7ZSU9_9BACT|nr:hypothetical protein [Lunatimonas lonarensis]EON77210.1 hypothetical protein ADIS_2290 [Lunatimonas lonarensis]